MHVRVSLSVISAALLVSAPAFAADKSSSNFAQPTVYAAGSPTPLAGPNSGAWTNGASKGKSKGDNNCKVQIQLKGTTLPDSDGVPGSGDEVICVADSKVDNAGLALDVSAIFRGEVDGGNVKIKADLLAENTGCGTMPSVIQYDARLACYAPDAGYVAGISIPFASDATQGVRVGSYAPRPASGLIATEGLYFP